MLHGPRARAAAARARYYKRYVKPWAISFGSMEAQRVQSRYWGGSTDRDRGFVYKVGVRGQHIDDVRIFLDEVCARVSRAATV